MTFAGRLWMIDDMFGPLGFQEVMFILVLALLIFGPRKLPQIGRTIGRTLSEFREASNALKRSLNAELADEELRQSDPRKLVRETFDEVRSLGADLKAPLREAESKVSEVGKEPEAVKPRPEVSAGPDLGVPDLGVPDPGVPDPGVPDPGGPDPGAPEAGTPDRTGAVSRGSIPADEPDSEPSRS